MSYTERFTECHQPLTALLIGLGAGEHNSGYAAVGTFHRAIFLLEYVIEDDPADTVDLDIEEATDAAGTGALTLKSTAQLVGTGGGDIVAVEVRMEEMTPGYSFLNAELTITGAAIATVIGFGIIPRYAPVSTVQWTEIVP